MYLLALALPATAFALPSYSGGRHSSTFAINDSPEDLAFRYLHGEAEIERVEPRPPREFDVVEPEPPAPPSRNESAQAAAVRDALDLDPWSELRFVSDPEDSYYRHSRFFDRYQPFPAITGAWVGGNENDWFEIGLGYEHVPDRKEPPAMRLSAVISHDKLVNRDVLRDVRSLGLEFKLIVRGQSRFLRSYSREHGDFFPFWRTAFVFAEVGMSVRHVERRYATAAPQMVDNGTMITVEGAAGGLGMWTLRFRMEWEIYSQASERSYQVNFEFFRPVFPFGWIIGWRGRDGGLGQRHDFLMGVRIEI